MTHPLDVPKLRRLGERLCDLSRGDDTVRPEILFLVRQLMVCLRDDCRADGAEVVAERIAGLADWREGAERMAEAAKVEILLYGFRNPLEARS